MRVPRDPAFRSYRIAVYCVYGAACTLLFVQLLRSVIGDLYGRRAVTAAAASGTACLDDVQRLYAELSARAVQPAPGGLESNQLSREWDAWSRRWEDDVERVKVRCRLDSADDPGRRALSDALDGIEELRRRLSRSGEDAASDARSVKDSLSTARKLLLK